MGRVVVTTVDRLSLREGPGTDANRIALLSVGTVGYVIEGPTSIDGWLWYRLSGMGLPFGTGCLAPPPDGTWSCPAFAGWVRMAGDDGQAWLAPTEVDCPRATLQSITAVGSTYRLVCWKRNDISFDAWWPELPDNAGLGGTCAVGEAAFLYCQNINYNGLTVAPRDGFEEQRLFLSIDPATGVQMPKRGQWIHVTGAFDHPAAAACADLAEGDEDPAIVVLRCRLQFVPSEVIPRGRLICAAVPTPST